MSVVVAREDVGPCQKRLTIEVPAQAVAAEMGRVVGDYRRKLNLPGFRRGKVPVELVKKRFREAIEREVADRLVPRYWHQAQAEENLDPLQDPEFEELQIEEGQPLTLVASVEIRPQITLAPLDDFRLPEEPTEPTDEEVEAALADLRRQHAVWSPVERSAARGDLVIAGVEDLERSGAPGSGGAASGPPRSGAPERKIHVELGADNAGEELTLALTGLAAGHSTEYRGALSPDGEEEAVRITALEVREQEVPELDDELARRLGDFDSVADLRRAVVEGLENSKKADLRRRRERSLLEQLRQRNPLELPTRVVEREAEKMVNRFAAQLIDQGVDLERADIDWQAMTDEARPKAEVRVHDRLLLDAVAEAEGLRLDESEFERFLAGLAAQQQTSTLELRRHLAEDGRLESLRADLLRGEAVRHLLGEDREADQGGETGGEPQEA